jgi:hypothetical protein
VRVRVWHEQSARDVWNDAITADLSTALRSGRDDKGERGDLWDGSC